MPTKRTRAFVLPIALTALSALSVAAGCARPSDAASPVDAHVHARSDARPTQTVQTQIVTPTDDTSERELYARGERALHAQQFREAALAFETLDAAGPSAELAPGVAWNLALAYEGLPDRERARDRYRTVVEKYGESANARAALSRLVSLEAYLEDWDALASAGESLLARSDSDKVDRMTGLAARALARIQRGEDAAALHDVLNGLDLVDELRYGATGRLPVPAAMLRFTLGEIRRVRSERIKFVPLASTNDFLPKLEARAQMLLDAQGAYADAIRSVDPHWAAMSGYRIGEMYRLLHRDLMEIPPTEQARTDKDRALFWGIMHVRYRVLLEKGLEMMNRTLALAEKTNDASAWTRRADAAKREIEAAIEEEKAAIAKSPYSEEELTRALDVMEKRARQGAGASPKAPTGKPARAGSRAAGS
jgi:tetratricopeptide (TPR) repeat protein